MRVWGIGGDLFTRRDFWEMKELLEIGLAVAGWALALLTIAGFWIPSALEWKEKLACLTPLMKELWWTYSGYVWGCHVFFTVILLGFPEWLMGRTGPAIALNILLVLWWALRLGLQFFGFDLSEVKDTFPNRVAKHLLTCLFVGLVFVFGATLLWNLGGIG